MTYCVLTTAITSTAMDITSQTNDTRNLTKGFSFFLGVVSSMCSLFFIVLIIRCKNMNNHLKETGPNWFKLT